MPQENDELKNAITVVSDYIESHEDVKKLIDTLSVFVERHVKTREEVAINKYKKEAQKLLDMISEIIFSLGQREYFNLRITDEKFVDIYPLPDDRVLESKGEFGTKYAYGRRIFGLTFNGVYIDSRILESGSNPGEEEYSKWKSANAGIEERIQVLEKEVSKKGLLAFLKKADKQKAAAELERLKEERKRGEKLHDQVDSFNRLTSEDKEAIRRYLQRLEELKKEASKFDELINNVGEAREHNADETINEDALIAQAKEEGVITEEQINKVIEELDSSITKTISTLIVNYPLSPYSYPFGAIVLVCLCKEKIKTQEPQISGPRL